MYNLAIDKLHNDKYHLHHNLYNKYVFLENLNIELLGKEMLSNILNTH